MDEWDGSTVVINTRRQASPLHLKPPAADTHTSRDNEAALVRARPWPCKHHQERQPIEKILQSLHRSDNCGKGLLERNKSSERNLVIWADSACRDSGRATGEHAYLHPSGAGGVPRGGAPCRPTHPPRARPRPAPRHDGAAGDHHGSHRGARAHRRPGRGNGDAVCDHCARRPSGADRAHPCGVSCRTAGHGGRARLLRGASVDRV